MVGSWRGSILACFPVWYSRVSGGREGQGPCIYSLSGAGGMGQGSKVLPLPIPKCCASIGGGNSPQF